MKYIALRSIMNIDNVMARFRSRDNQKKVGLSQSRKHIIITTYISLLLSQCYHHHFLIFIWPIAPKMIVLDDNKIKMACRPDRHFLNWFRPDRQLDQVFSACILLLCSESEKIKLNFKKKRFKEIILLIKMVAKSVKQMQSNGYRLNAGENSKLLVFESEEDWKKLYFLERVSFDLINFCKMNENNQDEIYVSMSALEKFLESWW